MLFSAPFISLQVLLFQFLSVVSGSESIGSFHLHKPKPKPISKPIKPIGGGGGGGSFPSIPVGGLFPGVLALYDDFNGDSLNTLNWEVETGCEDYSQGMLNCYTPGSNNIKVENGFLKITAKPEKYNGRNFTSGRITTRGLGFRTGLFTTRMKLPKGTQLWPAFWLVGTDMTDCLYEEVDILEYGGDEVSTVHNAAYYGRNSSDKTLVRKSRANVLEGVDLSSDFHEYTLIWGHEHMEWYVDSRQLFTVPLNPSYWRDEGPDKLPCIPAIPFDQSFRVIFDLNVGGIFFGNSTPVTPEEARQNWTQPVLIVDYVKVFQKLF